ncbi:MAG: 1-acyl-sn-glycerol-3-phosphate acyltransferase [Gammaproteobacteria bacterium]|jgi:1-acyl-sn-glycerol-3-phosphate acyltransferase
MLRIRCIVFAVAVALLTVVWAVVSLLAVVLPHRARYSVISRWNVMTRWLLKSVIGLDYRIEGSHNIPDTPCIVFCKHESAWETIILPIHFAPQTWVLKRELLWLPFFGWGLALLAPIAINRNARTNALQQVIEKGADRLARNMWVVIFPEGTRVAPGARKRYKRGGASLAAATGTPVLPIALNSGDFWGRNSFIKYPGTIDMVVGPIIETKGLNAKQISQQAEEWIESTVHRLRAPQP